MFKEFTDTNKNIILPIFKNAGNCAIFLLKNPDIDNLLQTLTPPDSIKISKHTLVNHIAMVLLHNDFENFRTHFQQRLPRNQANQFKTYLQNVQKFSDNIKNNMGEFFESLCLENAKFLEQLATYLHQHDNQSVETFDNLILLCSNTLLEPEETSDNFFLSHGTYEQALTLENPSQALLYLHNLQKEKKPITQTNPHSTDLSRCNIT